MDGEWIELDNAAGRWSFDRDFLESNWTCIWNAGCAGIADVAAPEAKLGCCSVGAEMLDDDEAMRIGALGASLTGQTAQFAEEIQSEGALRSTNSDRAAWATRVVDGACIFLNRPGFAGGAGCALHIAAAAEGESHLDWKPSVCWQLPLKIDVSVGSDGTTEYGLRRWLRADWGEEGETMAWCCTERAEQTESLSTPNAYVGDVPVIASLSEELTGLLGAELMSKLVEALEDRNPDPAE